jgi:hypothetical protein
MSRSIWIATAAAWAVSSLLLLASPTYWAPATVVDWAAVLAYTVAWLLFAPAIIVATRLVPSRVARIVGTFVAVGAVLAGFANLAGALTQVEAASTWLVDGILLATILLVPLAYLFARDRSNRLAVVALVLFLGIGFTAGGAGGLLVAVAFAALAYREDWFLPRRPAMPPELVTEGGAI